MCCHFARIELSVSLAGDYLLRAEILALHEADSLYDVNPIRGLQNYISCTQVTVTSDGEIALPAGIALPGNYTDTTPGIQFNIYTTPASESNLHATQRCLEPVSRLIHCARSGCLE
jgi:hypothetical protein